MNLTLSSDDWLTIPHKDPKKVEQWLFCQEPVVVVGGKLDGESFKAKLVVKIRNGKVWGELYFKNKKAEKKDEDEEGK